MSYLLIMKRKYFLYNAFTSSLIENPITAVVNNPEINKDLNKILKNVISTKSKGMSCTKKKVAKPIANNLKLEI